MRVDHVEESLSLFDQSARPWMMETQGPFLTCGWLTVEFKCSTVLYSPGVSYPSPNDGQGS